MKTDLPLTRRGWLAAIGGFAGVGAIAGFAGKHLFGRTLAAPLPPLVLPPHLGGLLGQRLRGLHTRYSGIRAAHGVVAMRGRIVSDLRGFAGHDEWQESVATWIEYGGWTDAADLLVDAAESGSVAVRRNVAALLSTRTTPLLLINGYAPRIVRLESTETDPLIRGYWRDLRRTLGI